MQRFTKHTAYLQRGLCTCVAEVGIAQRETDLLKKAVKLLMDKADPETRNAVLEIVKFYNEKPDYIFGLKRPCKIYSFAILNIETILRVFCKTL